MKNVFRPKTSNRLNWDICIAPPTSKPRAHHRICSYSGVHKQNQTETFSIAWLLLHLPAQDPWCVVLESWRPCEYVTISTLVTWRNVEPTSTACVSHDDTIQTGCFPTHCMKRTAAGLWGQQFHRFSVILLLNAFLGHWTKVVALTPSRSGFR